MTNDTNTNGVGEYEIRTRKSRSDAKSKITSSNPDLDVRIHGLYYQALTRPASFEAKVLI